MGTKYPEHEKVRDRRIGTPTIVDVAALAGVSIMTVSRVINGVSNVRDRTKELVYEAITLLDFAPNALARSLARGRPYRIGLIYSNPSAAYLSELLLGSLDQAANLNVQLVIEQSGSQDRQISVLERLIAGGIDGILLPPPLCESCEILDFLVHHNVPAVAVAAGRPPTEFAAVSIDDREAARMMTRHLLSLGHSRIGFITGNPNRTVSTARQNGYQLAMEEAGMTVDQILIAEGMFTYRSGLDAAEQLLSLDELPTAIFASNDDMAAATVATAHRLGLDVPGDLSICGFDDTTIATTIWPELTTVRQPIADMSRAAIKLLVEMVRIKQPQAVNVRHLTLDYMIVRRQSDGAPRRRPPVSVQK